MKEDKENIYKSNKLIFEFLNLKEITLESVKCSSLDLSLINEDLSPRIYQDNNEVLNRVPINYLQQDNIRYRRRLSDNNNNNNNEIEYGTNENTIDDKNLYRSQNSLYEQIITSTKQNKLNKTSSTIEDYSDNLNDYNHHDKSKSSTIVKRNDSFFKKLLKTSKENITSGCEKLVKNIQKSPNLLRKKISTSSKSADCLDVKNHQPIPPVRKKKLIDSAELLKKKFDSKFEILENRESENLDKQDDNENELLLISASCLYIDVPPGETSLSKNFKEKSLEDKFYTSFINKEPSSSPSISIEDVDDLIKSENNFRLFDEIIYPNKQQFIYTENKQINLRKRSKSWHIKSINENNKSLHQLNDYKNQRVFKSCIDKLKRSPSPVGDYSLSTELFSTTDNNFKRLNDNLSSAQNNPRFIQRQSVSKSYEYIDRECTPEYLKNYYFKNTQQCKGTIKKNKNKSSNGATSRTKEKTDSTTPLYSTEVPNKADNTKCHFTTLEKFKKKKLNNNYLKVVKKNKSSAINEKKNKVFNSLEKIYHSQCDSVDNLTSNKCQKYQSQIQSMSESDENIINISNDKIKTPFDNNKTNLLNLKYNNQQVLPINLNINKENNNNFLIDVNIVKKKKSKKIINMKPFFRMMRIKEKLIFAFSVFAILFTVLLVMDLQMDLGYSGHHLIPSHGRVKMADEQYRDTVYNNYRRRFNYRGINTSKEIISSDNLVVSTQNNNNNNELSGSDNNHGTDKIDKKILHDDFSDLIDIVMNDPSDVDIGVVKNSGEDYSDNLSVGEMKGITER